MFPSKALVVSSLVLLGSTASAAAVPQARDDHSIVKRGDVNLSFRPAPQGFVNFPDDPKNANLCLCYDISYVKCTCNIMLANPDADNAVDKLDKLDSCFSGSGGGGWTGFSNDKISSLSITGGVQIQCGFYDKANCIGQPLFTESSANAKVYAPSVPNNDQVSSFYCTLPSNILPG
ncbi:MAG: hypothetical protein Q9160_001995 [Pyrenula sp. 1 TL-2023]